MMLDKGAVILTHLSKADTAGVILLAVKRVDIEINS